MILNLEGKCDNEKCDKKAKFGTDTQAIEAGYAPKISCNCGGEIRAELPKETVK